jgi:hypothetical protein
MLTDVPSQALYNAIADVNSWNKSDVGLEYTRLEGETRPGAAFVWGPLGLLWRKVLGETQIKEAPAQLAAFVAYARASA